MMTLASFQAFANGKIAGKVADEKTGDVIIGATVMVQGTGKGTATDVDGHFQLEVPAGTYTVEIRYIGYQPKDISDVVVKEGEVTNLDAIISEDSKTTLKDVVVTASLKKESVNALYIMQKNSVSLSSGISADVIQRTPDRNTGEVLKRVSGASVKDNKYVVIRGLSDRYNLAMVNSALMPSTEPDKKAFSFDVIPSNLIDNIIINKTASPDLPGDFAGGIVQVMTKDVPEKDFFNVGVGLGYNTQTTFKDFRSSDKQAAGLVRFPGSSSELPSEFGDSYKDYKKLPEDKQLDAAKQLPNDYKETVAAAMPNVAVQASYGKASNLKNDGKLGTVIGLSYRNNHNAIPNFIRGKYETERVSSYSTDDMFRNSSNLAALANFSYVKGKSKISFKNLYNKMYDNTYYERNGYTTSNNQEVKLFSFVPSERQVFNTQLEGEHAIGTKNSKLTWNLNYANLMANQNDLRTAFYSRNVSFDANDEPISETSSPYKIVDRNSRRYFGNQVDHNIGAGANYSMPFQAFGQKQTVKVGYMGLYKTRTFAARVFQYEPQSTLDDNIAMQPVGQIFSEENIGVPGGFRLSEITNPTDKYDASGMLNAGYAMMDNNLGDKWRLTWGVRFESYTQTLQAIDQSGGKINDQDIFNDILPSFNLSHNMSEKSKFRFGASRTVNRPEFREIAPFQFIDFENLWTITGNPDLKRGNINNVDLRYEYYPNPGEAITIGAFYKGFENPIEAKMDDQSNLDLLIFSYQNAKAASSIGAEFDVRKTLAFLGEANWLANTTLGANFTYVHSKVDVSNITGVSSDRPLQGQSPYLVNFSALYSDPKSGLGISAMYNRIGQRIAVVGNSTIPTTWENGRDVIDLQLSKSLLKNRAEIKLTVADILNQPTTFYWNTDGKNSYSPGSSKIGNGNDQIFQQYRMGTTFTLGFNYRLGK